MADFAVLDRVVCGRSEESLPTFILHSTWSCLDTGSDKIRCNNQLFHVIRSVHPMRLIHV